VHLAVLELFLALVAVLEVEQVELMLLARKLGLVVLQ
jgi:hypothetical protein